MINFDNLRRYVVILKMDDGSGFNLRTTDAESAEEACEKIMNESLGDQEPAKIMRVFIFSEDTGDLAILLSRPEFK